MKDEPFAIGSVVAAFVASLCCLGPLVLGGIGLGAALVATFAPLRPYFLALSTILLVTGFYFVYRKPKAAEACEGDTCTPGSRTRRLAKPLLWLATLAVAALGLFPYYGARLVGSSAGAAPTATVQFETARLKITGMDCEVCAGVIQRRLSETRGVIQADVRYPAGAATVKYDASKITPAQIVDAVNATGFKAAVAN